MPRWDDEDGPHVRGSSVCAACWDSGYPTPCTCGGMIHSDDVDYSEHGPLVVFVCDRCGDKYEYADKER